jgi:FlaA1/EpsC-like NDP-sugar epimerase
MFEIKTDSKAQPKVNPLFRFCSLTFVFLTFLFVYKFYTVDSDSLLIVLSAISFAMVLVTNITAKFIAENNLQRARQQQRQRRSY